MSVGWPDEISPRVAYLKASQAIYFRNPITNMENENTVPAENVEETAAPVEAAPETTPEVVPEAPAEETVEPEAV